MKDSKHQGLLSTDLRRWVSRDKAVREGFVQINLSYHTDELPTVPKWKLDECMFVCYPPQIKYPDLGQKALISSFRRRLSSAG